MQTQAPAQPVADSTLLQELPLVEMANSTTGSDSHAVLELVSLGPATLVGTGREDVGWAGGDDAALGRQDVVEDLMLKAALEASEQTAKEEQRKRGPGGPQEDSGDVAGSGKQITLRFSLADGVAEEVVLESDRMTFGEALAMMNDEQVNTTRVGMELPSEGWLPSHGGGDAGNGTRAQKTRRAV